ncbi:acyl-CoA carboxylase subunit epsilon [Streptomyces sp. TRM43335]|uniref:Acyl-CoA carboxylase subunit epsilon n=1 Tax=Streptomyces taklimakanensis TaxID=2569853 RepID=A0A6G2BEN7_9ACTN|nr:acyl-CoA carboxylase subunit epsilon [Streptomyces taklimakanensis]
MIKVVRGNPTPEELAAALAVVRTRAAALAAAPGESASEPGSEWSDPARTVPGHRLPHPGPRAWRTTYWPG